MEEHPIEGLMITAMNSIQDMVDVNTIIGEPIETSNNVVVIPISKVTFGFAAGGSEFKGETIDEYTKKEKEEEIQYRLPFGGGSGAGVNISPEAFLIIQEGQVKLLPVNHVSAVDKLIDYVPDLLDKINKVLIVAQTTFSLQKFNEYVEEIKAWCNQNNIILDVKNTICNATKQRQEETENISKQVDFMIIIGGKNSSNTKKLFDISAKNCQKVVMIETYKDLENDIDTIITSNSIGIMAGASTPKKSITGVKEFINKICSQKIHGI